MGKTTALKWLFLNSTVKDAEYIYLNTKSFNNCDSIGQFLINLAHKIPNNKNSIIFLDGLDEFSFIKGSDDEWEKISEFINEQNSNNPNCRFVISTRPEHFGFNNLFVKNEIKKTPDFYAIFEIQMLTKKEAFDSCYLVKELNALDRKENYKHFINKWPSEDLQNTILTEKQYIHLLKEYLNCMSMEDSLFNNPLICRYGYQIICGWYSQRQAQSIPKTQSERINSVLKYIIKWEFHDHSNLSVENSLGLKNLESYENEVFDFLVKVVKTMGNKGYIEKKQWYDLKNNLKANAALCVLQEDLNGNLEFMHKIFENYFLAYYFSKELAGEYDNNKLDTFTTLLNSNYEFSIMYIEQLIDGSNEISKKVCNEIRKHENIDTIKFLDYAKGKRWFVLLPTILFSIEDYLLVFPNGGCIYAGNIYTKEVEKKLQREGILEIRDADYLTEFNKDIMFKKIDIIGIQSILPNINYLGPHFFHYLDGKFVKIYGMEFIEYHPKRKSIQESKAEHDKMYSSMGKMIDFMGEDKEFWCLFSNSYIYVYEIIVENEKNMVSIFNNGCLGQYASIIYGAYITNIEDENKILQKSRFYKIENIPFVFSAKSTLQQNSESSLSEYYIAHLNIISLLSLKTEGKSDNYTANVTLMKIESLYKENVSEKLQLYFSDEYLFLLYILEQGEDMVNLANNTINLCEKYNHLKGKKFRMFLINDDTSFTGNALNKVYEFSKEYIWI